MNPRRISVAILTLAITPLARSDLNLNAAPQAPRVANLVRTPISTALAGDVIYSISAPADSDWTNPTDVYLDVFQATGTWTYEGRGCVHDRPGWPIPQKLLDANGVHLVGVGGTDVIVYDTTDRLHPRFAASIAAPTAVQTRVLGDQLLLVEPTGIRVFSLDGPSGPTEIAPIPLSGMSDVTAIGDILFVLAADKLMALERAALPTVSVVAEYTLAPGTRQAAAAGSYIVVTTDTTVRRIGWDAATRAFTTSSNMQFTSTDLQPTRDGAATISTNGLMLYRQDGASFRSTSYSLSSDALLRKWWAVGADLAQSRIAIPSIGAGVTVLSLSTGGVLSPRTGTAYARGAKSIAFDNGWAYFADGNGLFVIADVRDPRAPFTIATISSQPLPSPYVLHGVRYPWICGHEQTYRLDNTRGLVSYGAGSGGIGFIGSTLLSISNSTLQTRDASGTTLGAYQTPPMAPVDGASIYEDRVLTYDDQTIRLYDFSDPAAPLEIASYVTASPIRGVFLGENVALVDSYLQGIGTHSQLIDLRGGQITSAADIAYHQLDTFGGLYDGNRPKFVADRLYYGANLDYSFAIDCSNPQAPQVLCQEHSHVGKYKGFAALGSYLFVSDESIPISRAPQPGDLNGDSRMNMLDIDSFVLALTDADAYRAAYPLSAIENADLNGDGRVDNFDIDPFVARLLNP